MLCLGSYSVELQSTFSCLNRDVTWWCFTDVLRFIETCCNGLVTLNKAETLFFFGRRSLLRATLPHYIVQCFLGGRLIVKMQRRSGSTVFSSPLQMCCNHRVCQGSAGSARGKGGGAWRDWPGRGLSVREGEWCRCTGGGDKQSGGSSCNCNSGGEMWGV